MSLAAEIKARKDAAALAATTEAQASAAALLRPTDTVKMVRPDRPDIAPTSITRPNASPAARRRQFLIASGAGVLATIGVEAPTDSENDNGPFTADEARMMIQLRNDQRTLKELQSTERKIAAKRTMLPSYDGWCLGVLAGGEGQRGPADEIFATIMVWLIDTGDYERALPMIDHLIRFGLAMPPRIERTAACFVAEEIAEAAIKAYRAGGAAAAAFPAGVLPMIDDLVDGEDMPDPVRAKLQKAIGMAIMAGAAGVDDEEELRQRREQTLKCYLRALELHDGAGVKKEIEQLQRDLGKPTVPGRLDQPAPGSGAGSNSDGSQPPA